MASSFSELGIELMVTGENAGTWGDKTNSNLNLIQQAIAGYQAVTVNGTGATTLAMTNSTISNARNQILKLSGTITGNITVTIPDSIEKSYIVLNSTSGAHTVQFKTVSGTGATWTATNKGYKILYSDGTNIVDISTDLGDINVGIVTSEGITTTGNIVPGANDTYDLGSASSVWRNLYTGDLHLSNQAKDQGNRIDGTKGNWTLQEGENDIFMINNISREKFKINLSKIKGDL